MTIPGIKLHNIKRSTVARLWDPKYYTLKPDYRDHLRARKTCWEVVPLNTEMAEGHVVLRNSLREILLL